MRNIFLFSCILCLFALNARASGTPWWEHSTICRLDTSACYAIMGTGYDTGLWDPNSKCWGMKQICANAVLNNTSGSWDPVPMTRNDISRGQGINTDFDVSVLVGDCFGARKTMSSGSLAMVNGKSARVWCNGILENPDERIGNGEISLAGDPSCEELAMNGYVAVETSGKCYGKQYSLDKYYISCDTAGVARMVILNGADYEENPGPQTAAARAPQTAAAAKELFDKMEKNSKEQYAKYFN